MKVGMNIWYAAYGSNLSRSRFDRYLRGGAPDGASHVYPGCRDGSDPSDDRPWTIERELAFGGVSRTWGGGVALLDPDRLATTLLRLYLVSIEQFEDIAAQENWLACGAVRLEHNGADEIDFGRNHTYGLGLRLGVVDDVPVFTITQHRGVEPAAPSPAYLRHIAQGLREAHDLSEREIVEYLMTKRGVLDTYTPDEVRRSLA